MTIDLEPRDRSRFLAVAILLAVFMAGTFAGATLFFLFRSDGHRVVEHRERIVTGPGEDIRFETGGPIGADVRIMKRHGPMLGEELGLDEDQQERVNRLMEEQHEKAERLMADMHPRMQALVDSTNAAIEGVLTPQQRERFRELQENRRELILRQFNIRAPAPPPAPPSAPRE